MRRLLRTVREIVAAILVAALFVTFPLRPVAAAAATKPQQSAPREARRTDRPEKQLEQQLLRLKRSVRAHLEGRPLSGQSVGQEIAAVRTELKNLTSAVESALRQDQKDLLQRQLPAVAQERYRAFADQYRNSLAELESRLDAVSTAPPAPAGLQALLQTLDRFTPSDRAQPLGADLPHGLAEGTAPEPRLQSAAAPGMSAAPSAAELAETPETTLTPALRAKAAELGSDPVAIYEFVHNEIRFEPYGGSRKGAAQTLAEGSGNDWDQASLLIALLRAAGYPARYAQGTVAVTAEQLQRWAGVRGTRPAVELLASSGMPVTGIAAGGDYTGARLEHVWVKAYVEVSDYRGVGAGTAEKGWIPLDPSFKQVAFVDGVDLSGYALPADLGAAVTEQLWIDPDQNALTNLQGAPIARRTDGVIQRLQQDLLAQGKSEVSVTDLLGGSRIMPEAYGLLPLSLPVQTVALLGEWAVVPPEHQTLLDFALSESGPFGLSLPGSTSFTYQAPLANLYGRRITVTYRPATAEDAAIISQYGSLIDVPPYLVEVVPQLQVDGQVVTEGVPVGPGNLQQAHARFLAGTRELSPADYPLVAGGVYSLVLDHGGDMSGLPDTAAQMAGFTIAQNYGAVLSETVMGPFLHAAGRIYWAESGADEAILAQRAGVVRARQPRAGMVGFGLSVGYLFFSPSVLDPGGFFFDIKQSTVAAVSHTGDRDLVRRFMLASGLAGSALEHGVWEQLTGIRAVSSVKLLSMASELAIPIYTLDQANIAQVLPTLDLSGGVKSEIQSAVSQGRQVVVPGQMLEYGTWQGAAYIVFDPQTGSAGYMIQGGLAGGSTSLVMDILVIIAAVYLFWVLIPATILLIESMLAGGLLAVLGYGFLAALNLAYMYEVTNDLEAYFGGDVGAGERIIFGALLVGALQLVARAVEGLLAARGVGEAFAALDRASGGAASQLVAQGLTKAEVVTIGEAVELRALVNFTQRYAGQLPPGFLKSIPQLIQGGALDSAGNIFRSQYVTVNLAKLSRAMAILDTNPGDVTALRTIDGAMRNLVGAHTEYVAEQIAASKGATWLLPRTHININGIDMAAKFQTPIAAIEVKGTIDATRVFTTADLSTYIKMGTNGQYYFDVTEFLARLAKRPDLTQTELMAIRNALNNGTFEFWAVINSANPGAVGADLATLVQQGITYTAPNRTTQVMKFIIEHVWR